jgi:peptide/nickel transport system permease protein
MLAVFYGALEWAPGPGQISASTFPPPTITGIMLIDAPLAGDWDTFWDAAAHLVLPSIVLAASTLGLITRTTRAAMLEALSQDYIHVARAKGLPRRSIMLGHAFPKPIQPVVTAASGHAQLLTEQMLTESFSLGQDGTLHVWSAVRLAPAITGITRSGRRDLRGDQPADRSVAPHSIRACACEKPKLLPRHALRQREVDARRGGAATARRWAGEATVWLLAVLAPWIAPYPPDVVNVAGRLLPPSDLHWLGTDVLGRDVFTRVLYGARTSLAVGFVVVLLGALFGTLLGAVAAYIRGWAEEALMRATDLVFCFPPIILAMAIAASLGIGTRNTVIAMLVVWWPKFARLARSLVIGQRSAEYVAAAQAIGFGPSHILFRQIIPNAVGPLVVLVTLDLGNAILVFAGLSFLGLGVVPPTAEWGSMVSEGRELVNQWWVATFPGLAILTVVIGFNFVGDGIRDWLDPHARRR